MMDQVEYPLATTTVMINKAIFNIQHAKSIAYRAYMHVKSDWTKPYSIFYILYSVFNKGTGKMANSHVCR